MKKSTKISLGLLGGLPLTLFLAYQVYTGEITDGHIARGLAMTIVLSIILPLTNRLSGNLTDEQKVQEKDVKQVEKEIFDSRNELDEADKFFAER